MKQVELKANKYGTAFSTVSFAYLHYNVIPRGCAFSLNYIVMQMRKVAREKGYPVLV